MARMENPLLGVLVGTLFTVLIQSSSATLGIVITLASQGIITLPAGIALMLGAEFGTCADTLVATIGRSAAAVRTGVFHLLFNVTTVLIGVLLASQLADVARSFAPADDVARQVANAHMIFNVAGVLLVIWFTPLIARALVRLVPGREPAEEPADRQAESERAVQVPGPRIGTNLAGRAHESSGVRATGSAGVQHPSPVPNGRIVAGRGEAPRVRRGRRAPAMRGDRSNDADSARVVSHPDTAKSHREAARSHQSTAQDHPGITKSAPCATETAPGLAPRRTGYGAGDSVAARVLRREDDAGQDQHKDRCQRRRAERRRLDQQIPRQVGRGEDGGGQVRAEHRGPPSGARRRGRRRRGRRRGRASALHRNNARAAGRADGGDGPNGP
jgi:hypothetical protein